VQKLTFAIYRHNAENGVLPFLCSPPWWRLKIAFA